MLGRKFPGGRRNQKAPRARLLGLFDVAFVHLFWYSEYLKLQRASLLSKREARIFFGFHDGMLIALHAIIKKTQRTPPEELTLARQRFKELQSWHGKTRT
jgi:hypothetical protein